MALCLIGTVLILAIVGMFIAIARATSVDIDGEDVPGEYDYGEPPYNSYKYN